MNRSSLLAVFAWFFDVVIIECIIWPLNDLLESNYEIAHLLSLLFLLIVFSLTIFYHVHWKRKTNWISPGEYLTGQRIQSNGKQEFRMFSIHRTLLFSVILLNLLSTARSLEVSYFGVTEIIMILLINYSYNFFLLFGSFKLSEVKWSGLLIIGVALSFMVGKHAFDYFSIHIQSARNMFIYYGLLLLINGWVYYYYKNHKELDKQMVS